MAPNGKPKLNEEGKVPNPFVATENTEAGPDAVALDKTAGAEMDEEHKDLFAPAGAKVVQAHPAEPELPAPVEEVIKPRKPKDWEPHYAHAPVSGVLYANVEPDPGNPLPVVEGAKPVEGAVPVVHEDRFMVVVGFKNENDANAFRDSLMSHASPLVLADQPAVGGPDTATRAPDVDGSKAVTRPSAE